MTSDDALAADGAAALRVALLGPVRAWRGETELELGAPQRRAVLGLLAARANQAVSRDKLIDGIWGDELPARSVNALHVHVSRLRAALDPGRAHRAPGQVLQASGRGYLLRLAPGQLDAELFAGRLAAARESRRVGDLTGAASSFESAMRLWRGVALDGIPGPWAEIVRAALAEQRLTATEEHLDGWRQGRYQDAADYHQQSLAASAAIGDRRGEAMALANLGTVYERRGRYQQAAHCHRQALAAFRSVGDRTGEARALANLGSVAGREGEYEQAVGWYQQALTVFRETGDLTGEASALPDLGIAYQRQGRYEEAVGCYQRALALFRETGDRTGEAEARNGVAEILLATGRPDEASVAYTAALALAGQLGDTYEQARAHNGLAAALHAAGDVSLARHHRRCALELYSALGAPEADAISVELGQRSPASREQLAADAAAVVVR